MRFVGSLSQEINKKPFIIAELSGNHNQSLDKALRLVEEAAKAGVDAVKIQTYTPDTMTLNIKNNEFVIDNPDNIWNGHSLYDLYEKAYTPWEWHNPIFEKCHELGVIPFSSPFDETAVDFLESLNVPMYKIASFENIDLPLIKKVASTGKPIIISTGMASIAELDDAVRTAKEAGCKDIVLLKCTSTYPASPKDTNLLTIPHMRELFDCEVGLSDHTLGIGVAVASISFGAKVIEKHLTLSRSEGGVDAAFSLEPNELKQLVTEANRAFDAIGQIKYGPTEKEKNSLKRRRSIYIVKDIKAGEILTKEHIKCIRPGLGLSPKYFNVLVGKTVKRDLKKGTPMSWDIV
ncbi:pseudaminic acid synthase [Rossellomorea aquimaris]|uniref:pseudaminic acid synthase n=1 Tax=Rossellomorea aquimaris TaxID=189382 RepID=UPI001CD270D6|nr:pseudaminic acid synthase [Rossellomorea aquimaris]MCA1055309.1 pseudaminic acid synthase [Rossellomorea aquimaris]